MQLVAFGLVKDRRRGNVRDVSAGNVAQRVEPDEGAGVFEGGGRAGFLAMKIAIISPLIFDEAVEAAGRDFLNTTVVPVYLDGRSRLVAKSGVGAVKCLAIAEFPRRGVAECEAQDGLRGGVARLDEKRVGSADGVSAVKLRADLADVGAVEEAGAAGPEEQVLNVVGEAVAEAGVEQQPPLVAQASGPVVALKIGGGARAERL